MDNWRRDFLNLEWEKWKDNRRRNNDHYFPKGERYRYKLVKERIQSIKRGEEEQTRMEEIKKIISEVEE